WALREWINHLDEVDAWHVALEPNDRAHLNNPIDVWERFSKDGLKRSHRQRLPPPTRQRRGYPSLLEELQALQETPSAVQSMSKRYTVDYINGGWEAVDAASYPGRPTLKNYWDAWAVALKANKEKPRLQDWPCVMEMVRKRAKWKPPP